MPDYLHALQAYLALNPRLASLVKLALQQAAQTPDPLLAMQQAAGLATARAAPSGASSSGPTATSSTASSGPALQLAAREKDRLEFQQTGLVPRKDQPAQNLVQRTNGALNPIRRLLDLTLSDPVLREAVSQVLQMAQERQGQQALPDLAGR